MIINYKKITLVLVHPCVKDTDELYPCFIFLKFMLSRVYLIQYFKEMSASITHMDSFVKILVVMGTKGTEWWKLFYSKTVYKQLYCLYVIFSFAICWTAY